MAIDDSIGIVLFTFAFFKVLSCDVPVARLYLLPTYSIAFVTNVLKIIV